MQSDLHKELSTRAIAWVRSRATIKGVRGLAEVQVSDSYIADAVVLANLQYRFKKQYKIPVTRKDYLIKVKPFDTRNLTLALIFETKVSRSDFLNTFKENGNNHDNRLNPVGNLHLIITPPGLVSPDEVPRPWGLLEQSGNGLREIAVPVYCEISDIQLYRIAASMLWRDKQ